MSTLPGMVAHCTLVASVYALFRPSFHRFRCFTFGIGSGASSALVEGLAQAGNGTAEFVKDGERMQPKVSIEFI